MTLKRRLIKSYYTLLRQLKIPFYFRRQKYQVEYIVYLKNKSQKKQRFSLIVPIPRNTPNQEIINLNFSVNGVVKKEKQYHNQYFLGKITLSPNEEKEIKEEFTAIVSPISPSSLNPSLLPSIKKIYFHVKDTLNYGNPIRGLYTAKQTLKLPCVDCGGFVSLLCFWLKDLPLTCRPIFGFFAGYQNNSMHAWAEVTTPDKKVLPLDPTVEKLFEEGRSFKSGGFGWLGSDRIIFSYGSNYHLEIGGKKIRVDILQTPFILPKNESIDVEFVFKTKRV